MFINAERKHFYFNETDMLSELVFSRPIIVTVLLQMGTHKIDGKPGAVFVAIFYF